MRFLHIKERHYINIDSILSINWGTKPFIQIVVNGHKLYDLRYTQENYDEFCIKLVEKIADDELKIVDMQQIKNEVCML